MEQVIPQEITKNLIVEELSLVDKVKKYAIEGLIIAALVIGAGFISPSIFNALSPLLNKIPALANHRDLLLKVFNALLSEYYLYHIEFNLKFNLLLPLIHYLNHYYMKHNFLHF